MYLVLISGLKVGYIAIIMYSFKLINKTESRISHQHAIFTKILNDFVTHKYYVIAPRVITFVTSGKPTYPKYIRIEHVP